MATWSGCSEPGAPLRARLASAGAACARAAALALLALPAAAQEPAPEASGQRDWWLGLEAGYARLEDDGGPGQRADDGWALAFRGGVRLDERWLVGLELGGIGFEAGDLWDPSKGRSLGDVLVLAEYHPAADGGWYLHAGAGWVSYVDNASSGTAFEGDGWSARAGLGYDWQVGEGVFVGLLGCWDFGSIEADSGDDWSYDAFRLSMAWSLR